MTRLAAAVAGGLVLVLLAPAFSLALLTFCVAGVLNAFFFAATLAGRSEFAPREARGQVFIWVGALKIAAGSAGTAAAGATIGHAAWLPLVIVITLTFGATLTSIIDRRTGTNDLTAKVGRDGSSQRPGSGKQPGQVTSNGHPEHAPRPR